MKAWRAAGFRLHGLGILAPMMENQMENEAWISQEFIGIGVSLHP